MIITNSNTYRHICLSALLLFSLFSNTVKAQTEQSDSIVAVLDSMYNAMNPDSIAAVMPVQDSAKVVRGSIQQKVSKADMNLLLRLNEHKG